jgi:hypothetical protein
MGLPHEHGKPSGASDWCLLAGGEVTELATWEKLCGWGWVVKVGGTPARSPAAAPPPALPPRSCAFILLMVLPCVLACGSLRTWQRTELALALLVLPLRSQIPACASSPHDERRGQLDQVRRTRYSHARPSSQ